MLYYTVVAGVGAGAGFIHGSATEKRDFETRSLIEVASAVTSVVAVVAFKALEVTFATLGTAKLAFACSIVLSAAMPISVCVVAMAVSMVITGCLQGKF